MTDLAAEVRELRERMVALEAQREADRQNDRDSRHAHGSRVNEALAAVQLQVERGMAAINARLDHNDGCTDAARSEAAAARAEVKEVRQDVAKLDGRLDTFGEILARLATASAEQAKALGQAAWLTPAATSGGAGAVVGGLLALGKALGWW